MSPADDRTAPLTRRALADERGGPDADPEKRGRRSRKGIVAISIVLILVVLLAAAVWLAFRALTVRNELAAAQNAVSQIQSGGDVAGSLDVLGGHARTAADAAGDPVWRLAELLPFVGPNLQGVRLAADSLDVLANDLALPAYTELNAGGDEPVFARILPALEGSTPEIVRLAEQIEGVQKSDALIPQVREGVDMVAPIMVGAADALPVLPELLGGNGPRNYLLVSQNNAESVGLGGSAASQTLLHVDNGSIEIARQANSQSYKNGSTAVDVEVPESALTLYSDYLVRYINTSASRPDFPTMAQIVSAWWQRDIAPDQIDGVIAVDPIALGYMLEATGPVALATGDELNADNTADLLLNGIYMRWGEYWQAPLVDDFFANAAATIFENISTGDFDPMDMAAAVGEGIDGGNIMFWTPDDELQAKIAPLRVSGILPETNEESTAVGVFFRDESMSKIDYYMKSGVNIAESCADGARTFTTTARLHLDIEQSVADALPEYIRSGHWGSQQFRTQVYVYGPPGTAVGEVGVDGRAVSVVRTDVDDLGRPVAWFTVDLAPGEEGRVTASFVGDDGDYGPIELRSTPMINKTEAGVSSEGCAAR